MNKPNFFIVGAPKSGTTAMNDYLSQHPDVYMATKEIHYFGSDLMVRTRPSEPEYLDCFKEANGKKIIGESSVWYLFSKNAAQEIKAFAPEAKILIMLRNPVDVMYALHSQQLYDANEDVLDFETALALDEARKKGHNLPKSLDFIRPPSYIDSVLFADQVTRYLQVFGSDQVHIVLFDEFITDTPCVVERTLQFLGVNTQAKINYEIVNPNKQIGSFKLHQLIKIPPSGLQAVVRVLLPFKKIRHAIMSSILKRNIKEKKRSEMNPSLRAKLQSYVKPDVQKLSQLIGRDLSGWL